MPESMTRNQWAASAGLVPSATNLLWGCLPSAVLSADLIASLVVLGQELGSSAKTSTGAKPIARFGSLPMHRTLEPDGLYSILAFWAVSQTRHFFLLSKS